jgi:hypothetical protein
MIEVHRNRGRVNCADGHLRVLVKVGEAMAFLSAIMDTGMQYTHVQILTYQYIACWFVVFFRQTSLLVCQLVGS